MACVIVARMTTKCQYWSTSMVDLYVWLSLLYYILTPLINGNANDNNDCNQSCPALHLISVVINVIKISSSNWQFKILFSIWQWGQSRPNFHVPWVKFIRFIDSYMYTKKWSGALKKKIKVSDEIWEWVHLVIYMLCNWLEIKSSIWNMWSIYMFYKRL